MGIERFVLVIAVASFLLEPMQAQAKPRDMQSFWEGYILGSGSTVCVLLENGLLSRNDSKEWLEDVLARNPRETLDNPANPRDNGSVIAGHGWFHGRQAARIR
jgi:hypothetical protein